MAAHGKKETVHKPHAGKGKRPSPTKHKGKDGAKGHAGMPQHGRTGGGHGMKDY